MATLALSAAGAAAGAAFLPSVSVLGSTISGAAIGQAIGATVGSYVDQALFGASGQARVVEGPRLASLQVMGSTEGAPIPRLYGRARMAGQVIWATHLEEVAVTERSSTGHTGKGLGGGGQGGTEARRVDYSYFANFAVGLCEGEITRIGRVWADGKPISLAGYTYRLYKGSETQAPDSLILAKEGANSVPAYRGLAYIVFERMPLERFGNRIPQLSFEVFRAVDRFEDVVRAITIIPAAGEFAYEPAQVLQDRGLGVTVAENLHSATGETDWTSAIDQLEAELPNARRASLVAAWFGTDLRAAHCELKPGVESPDKVTVGKTWSVAGLTRAQAHVVSRHDDRPAFGGTPNDASLIAAIKDLKARGIAVTFYPFILMDVPAGNMLADPYGGSAQAVYPWRGRITLDIAPGRPGSPDKTATAAAQVAAFTGTAQRTDFAVNGETVSYSGPAEWSYRRMILHYAHLCKAAGGVDAFLIGSELRGLTTIRSSASSYPFVATLVSLAADVKAVLGPATKVSYAADWSEYFGHHPQDGSGDVYFHLDPLWASADIDAVGIDVYWPLSDWRDGDSHLDRNDSIESPHELGYLKSNIFGGEGYAWYYASPADRDSQQRTPITDGAGKPWVFRFKDIRSWWLNAHYNRPGGVESGTATAWVPQSKPIWFTETGCPAVDKGANQPNVFYDPKSSESFLPHYSLGVRDDLIQRRYLQAIAEFFDPAHDDYIAGSNPVSTVYGGRMVDRDRIYAYTWDARPYPAFPLASDVWADGSNWEFGHWLTGRLGGGSLPAVLAAILEDYGFERFAIAGLTGTLEGYVIDRIMSVRQAIQPLELAFFFDAIESAGVIRFQPRGRGGSRAVLTSDDLVETSADVPLFELVRTQESELPAVAKIGFLDSDAAYSHAAADSRRLTVASERVASADLPLVMDGQRMQSIAERWLHETWSARERARFAVPPSRLALEVGDVVTWVEGDASEVLRITGQTIGTHKSIEARSIRTAVYAPLQVEPAPRPHESPRVFGPSMLVLLDLPLVDDTVAGHDGFAAAFQSPWPGAVALLRSGDGVSYREQALISRRASLGSLIAPLAPGPEGRWDAANPIEVELANGVLVSRGEEDVLSGSNAAAIQADDGSWEIVQFQYAELIAPRRYRLTRLLRGQAGSEQAMLAGISAGARFVLLDAAVTSLGLSRDVIGLETIWRFGPAGLDPAHESFTATPHAFRGTGLKPLSPVHVAAQAIGSDRTIRWQRRTRIGGDNWEPLEVPLGEEAERYEVDIMDGAQVKRTLTTIMPEVTYTLAAQVADWGAPQSNYSVRVYQVSPSYGRGSPRAAII